MTESSITQEYPLRNSPSRPHWHRLLLPGIILNAFVWALVFAYLKLANPSYTSTWGVKILEGEGALDVSLPDVGTAGFERPGKSHDRRNDYVYIATSEALLERAAQETGLSLEDYGGPAITVDRDSGIISFQIQGETPEQTRDKAQAHYQALTTRIEELRQGERERREQDTQATLQDARQKLDAAQEKLSNFRTTSGLSTNEQISEISLNLEQLRREQVQLVAQEQGLNGSVRQLSGNLNVSSSKLDDVYKLQSDGVYTSLLDQYAQVNTSYTNLLSRLTPQHPDVIQSQAELSFALNSLAQRASLVLGKPVNAQEVQRLTTLDPDTVGRTLFEDLYGQRLNNQVESEKLKAQHEELGFQIGLLENRLKALAKQQSTLDRLNRDLQVAEAVFTSTLAKLDLGKDGVYTLYPPLQLVVEPSLPDEDDPDSPSKKTALIGGLAGSLLVTTGLVLLGYDPRKPEEA